MGADAKEVRNVKGVQDDPRPARPPGEGAEGVPDKTIPQTGKVRLRGRYLIYGFFFKTRGLWGVLLLFAMFFTTRWEAADAALSWVIGLVVYAPGVVIRIRSQQYLRYRLRNEGVLATAGPYTWVRNPVYIGNTLGLAGLCIMCKLYWMAPVVAAWALLAYHLSVRFEEMRLAKRFGEVYQLYCERVPRWFPRRPSTTIPQISRAGFWRAVAVEWQCLVLLLVPLGKGWAFGPHAGHWRAILSPATDFVVAHRGPFVAALAIGLVALAALNLARLRSR